MFESAQFAKHRHKLNTFFIPVNTVYSANVVMNQVSGYFRQFHLLQLMFILFLIAVYGK